MRAYEEDQPTLPINLPYARRRGVIDYFDGKVASVNASGTRRIALDCPLRDGSRELFYPVERAAEKYAFGIKDNRGQFLIVGKSLIKGAEVHGYLESFPNSDQRPKLVLEEIVPPPPLGEYFITKIASWLRLERA